MVQAKVICERFNIPRGSLYQLVKDGRIPAHEEPPRAYYKRPKRRLLFAPSEVEAALARLKESRPPTASVAVSAALARLRQSEGNG